MNNVKLWAHWIPIHDANPYLDYMSKLKPGGIKIIDPDVSHISRAYVASPNSIFILRDHPLSEQKGDMYNDPHGTALRHAMRWNEKVRQYYLDAAVRSLPMPPRENLVVLGINEPDVESHILPTILYTSTFLDALRTQYNLTGGALNLSVGWPANTGKDTPPNWQPFVPVYESIKRGNHYLVLHEYWGFGGPDEMWGWHAGRFTKVPWRDVKIIIGECGVDQHVMDGKGHKGWKKGLSPNLYVDQVERYISRSSEDPRFLGACLFTDDYGSSHWESFDSLAAHPAILSKKWTFAHTPQQLPSSAPNKSLRLPFVGRFRVTQRFGENPDFYKPFKGHLGIDWATPMNTPVIAIDDGVVTEVYELNQWGKYIKILHDWGESVYAHLNSQHVRPRDRVTAGQFIGYTGNTGRSTGPHLHLGVRILPYDRKDGWDGYSDPELVLDMNRYTMELPQGIPSPAPEVVGPQVYDINPTGPSLVKINTSHEVTIEVSGKHTIKIGA